MIFAMKIRSRVPAFLLVVSAIFLFAARGIGQTAVEAAKLAAEASRTAASLPPESRAVIERLSNLRVLPDGVWKMHSGDLAHGEAVDAD